MSDPISKTVFCEAYAEQVSRNGGDRWAAYRLAMAQIKVRPELSGIVIKTGPRSTTVIDPKAAALYLNNYTPKRRGRAALTQEDKVERLTKFSAKAYHVGTHPDQATVESVKHLVVALQGWIKQNS